MLFAWCYAQALTLYTTLGDLKLELFCDQVLRWIDLVWLDRCFCLLPHARWC